MSGTLYVSVWICELHLELWCIIFSKSTTPFLQIFSICAPNVLVTAVPGGSVRLSDLTERSREER